MELSLGYISGQLQSFLERLTFPYLVYDNDHSSIAPKKMPIGFIYTMNVTEEIMKKMGYLSTFNNIEHLLERMFVKPSVIYSYNTYQFDDYSKYKAELFSEEEKAKYRKIHFPVDCQKAFELGINLIK